MTRSPFVYLALMALIRCGGIAGSDGGTDSSADVGADGTTFEAGSDATADADTAAPPMDGGIASIPGLALWLDAEKGVTHTTTVVSAWADQSGHNNGAAQATSSQAPSYGASVINGLPALHFTQGAAAGSQLVVQDAPSLQWGTGDFLIEVVARYDNAPTGGVATGIGLLYYKPGALEGIIFAANRLPGGNPPASAGLMARIDINVPGNGNQVDVGAGYDDGVPRNFAFRRTGTTLDLRVSGVSVASMTQVGVVDVSAAQANVFIGADDTDTVGRLDGDIAEVIAVKGPTSAQDLAAIEGYLKSKYNL